MLFSMESSLRVVFAGTPDNAAFTLERLRDAGVNVVGVLTRTDARVGRNKQLQSSPVADAANRLGLPVHKANSIDEQCMAWLRGLNADIGAVVAYGTIFRKDVLEIPRLGWLNLHYSLLPEFPGAAPVQHALLLGKKITGVTVFRLDEGIDTGPIIRRSQLDIHDDDTAGTLLNRLSELGAELMVNVLLAGESQIEAATPQELHKGIKKAAKPNRELAKLDFNSNATDLSNKVRAMNPEPMAWFELEGVPVRVITAKPAQSTSGIPGEAMMVDGQLVVVCRNGALALEVVQPSGKREMSSSDWFRGLRAEKLMLS
jgi:methionyl-tRNA formyltransferase